MNKEKLQQDIEAMREKLAERDALIEKLTTRLSIANRVFNEIGYLIDGKGAPANCTDILLHRKHEINKTIEHGIRITHTEAFALKQKESE